MKRTVAEKMGIKPGTRALLVDAPPEAVAAIELPQLNVAERRIGEFGYIHLFVTTQAKLDATFPDLRSHLNTGGMLWVSWPKGRKLGTDLTIKDVIRIGYKHGLVESTALRIDDTWSGLKFTRPKPGKTYSNSYGKLPGAQA